MNIWIINHFNTFLAKDCSNTDLFGKCFSTCRQFLEYIENMTDDKFDVKRNDYNTVTITYNDKVCSVKIIDCICCYNEMIDFQKHAIVMANKSPIIGDKIPIECTSIKGIKYTYHSNNIYTKTSTNIQMVGILHWVLYVDRKIEQYILDPTLQQFHTPPPILVVQV